MLERIIEEQVTPDLDTISRLLIKLSFSVDEQSPKDLLLMRLAREAYTRGHKPVLIAGYADTATRTFIRVVDLIPDARWRLCWVAAKPGCTSPETISASRLAKRVGCCAVSIAGRAAAALAGRHAAGGAGDRGRCPERFCTQCPTELTRSFSVALVVLLTCSWAREAISVGHNLTRPA